MENPVFHAEIRIHDIPQRMVLQAKLGEVLKDQYRKKCVWEVGMKNNVVSKHLHDKVK